MFYIIHILLCCYYHTKIYLHVLLTRDRKRRVLSVSTGIETQHLGCRWTCGHALLIFGGDTSCEICVNMAIEIVDLPIEHGDFP